MSFGERVPGRGGNDPTVPVATRSRKLTTVGVPWRSGRRWGGVRGTLVSRRRWAVVVWVALLVGWWGAFASTAFGALVLTVTGTPGSSRMAIDRRGSVATTGSAAEAKRSSFFHLPGDEAEWKRVGNNVGDFLGPGWAKGTSEGRELLLEGDLRVVGTGSSAFSFAVESLRLDDDVTAGGDDFDLRFGSTQTYPDYPAGLTVSVTGSGTFTLEDGNTFDDLVAGHYRLPGWGEDGAGVLEFAIIPKTVPEPSVMGLIGGALGWWLTRRRRVRALR